VRLTSLSNKRTKELGDLLTQALFLLDNIEDNIDTLMMNDVSYMQELLRSNQEIVERKFNAR
jgi:hypothetical protein